MTRIPAPSRGGASAIAMPPSASQRSSDSSLASMPPATIASARPVTTRSAACAIASNPAAPPAVTVTAGPPSRNPMPTSPAAAFETVAANSRGLATLAPSAARRR